MYADKPGFILGRENNGVYEFNAKILDGVCRTCLCTDKPMLDLSEHTLIQIQAVISSCGVSYNLIILIEKLVTNS